MKLVNGTGKTVNFTLSDIRREASRDDGFTSYVVAENERVVISLSQHESGDWDIGLNEEPYSTHDEEDGDEAVKEFMELVREYA